MWQILPAFQDAGASPGGLIYQRARVSKAIINNIWIHTQARLKLGQSARQWLVFRPFADLIKMRVDATRFHKIIEEQPGIIFDPFSNQLNPCDQHADVKITEQEPPESLVRIMVFADAMLARVSIIDIGIGMIFEIGLTLVNNAVC